MLFREWETPEAASVVAIEPAAVTISIAAPPAAVEAGSRTPVDRDMRELNLVEY